MEIKMKTLHSIAKDRNRILLEKAVSQSLHNTLVEVSETDNCIGIRSFCDLKEIAFHLKILQELSKTAPDWEHVDSLFQNFYGWML